MESYVAGLGFELVTPGFTVKHPSNCASKVSLAKPSKNVMITQKNDHL